MSGREKPKTGILQKKSPSFPAMAGAPSVLVVLVCLCLTALCVLSLIGARNEYTLAERTAEETELYYASDEKACEALAAMLDEYEKTGSAVPPEGGTVSEPDPAAGTYPGKTSAFLADYGVPCGENATIQCSVLVFTDGSYDIITWKKVFSAEQTYFDDSMNVWSGD